MAASDRQRRAEQRAQQQLARILKRLQSPKRATIPWLEADPAVGDGIHLWMRLDGTLRGYRPDGTLMQYSSTTPTTPGGSWPADPEPALIQTTYAAAWGRSFCDVHGLETGTSIGYGDSADGTHAARKIMIGLPDSTIRTDITSSGVIRQVEISILNVDANTDTVNLHVGAHNRTAAPAGYSEVSRDAAVLEYPKVGMGAQWRTIHPGLGRLLRDDLAKGITLNQPAGSLNGGSLDWASVKLRLTYTV